MLLLLAHQESMQGLDGKKALELKEDEPKMPG